MIMLAVTTRCLEYKNGSSMSLRRVGGIGVVACVRSADVCGRFHPARGGQMHSRTAVLPVQALVSQVTSSQS